jgi:hypothetical protein
MYFWVVKKIYLYITTVFASGVMAQEEVTPKLIFPGDPIPKEFVDLKEVIVLQPIKFNNYEELRRYALLKRRTLKVYPYAKLASNRLTTLRDRLTNIKGKRKKKRYTRQVEKYLQGEFTDELKKLTRSEGRILVKLIHRETGSTTHAIIKDLRSGWRAFLYQTTARMFDIDLRTEFQPNELEEDRWIEDILYRSGLTGL